MGIITRIIIKYYYKFIVCDLLVKLSNIYPLSLKFDMSSFTSSSVTNFVSFKEILKYSAFDVFNSLNNIF